jgi:hypothetical protein
VIFIVVAVVFAVVVSVAVDVWEAAAVVAVMSIASALSCEPHPVSPKTTAKIPANRRFIIGVDPPHFEYMN